ncbi:hypothetical protein LTR85_005910 [Meristemomyces frigidus]|nr:hypothetical protein LTR85_005910 [Meristemomyces frigidus]
MATAAISEASFLRLPPELRNSIYELFFGYGECDYFNPVLSFWGLQHCQCLDLTLMRVCRQTREETFKLFYDNHDFRFILKRSNKAAIEGWLNSIGQEGIANIHRFHLKGYSTVDYLQFHCFSAHRAACRAGTINVELGETGVASWITCGHCGSCVNTVRQVREKVNVVLEGLPRVEGKPLLTKDRLLQVFNTVGWS